MRRKYLFRKSASLFFALLLCLNFSVSGQLLLKDKFFGEEASEVLVVAHRAAHNHAPENSLRAIEAAISLGVDIIEIDVRITGDGIPVLMHDETVDRTTNGRGEVSRYSFEELRKLRLKNPNNSLDDQKVPTLEEALKLAYGKILVDLDLKLTEIEPVIKVVKKTETEKQVFFFDSDYKVLKRIKKIDESLYLMPRTYSFEQVKMAIDLFHPPVVHIDPGFYTTDVVDYIKAHNARVWINSLGDRDDALRENGGDSFMGFLKNGANVIQTDEPEILLVVLKGAGLH